MWTGKYHLVPSFGLATACWYLPERGLYSYLKPWLCNCSPSKPLQISWSRGQQGLQRWSHRTVSFHTLKAAACGSDFHHPETWYWLKSLHWNTGRPWHTFAHLQQLKFIKNKLGYLDSHKGPRDNQELEQGWMIEFVSYTRSLLQDREMQLFQLIHRNRHRELRKIRYRNMLQMKEQGKTSEKDLSEMEISHLPVKEFKVMVLKMLLKPGRQWMFFKKVKEKWVPNRSHKVEEYNYWTGNTLGGFRSRPDEAGLISDLEHRTVELTQTEQLKEKRIWESKGSLRDLWDNTRQHSICIIGILEGGEGKSCQKIIKK